jgi:hypothetical protein
MLILGMAWQMSGGDWTLAAGIPNQELSRTLKSALSGSCSNNEAHDLIVEPRLYVRV